MLSLHQRPAGYRDFAGEITEAENPGDTPENILERLGFPRPVQYREVRVQGV